VKIEPEKLYQEIGIYCFGRGIFHKTPRTGLEVGDKDLFLMKEGDFILQVTFAWEGAIAIVSAAEDGMYGSTRYPTFRVDESRCDPKFLLNYFKTEEGLQQLVNICPGSAGRNRVLSIKRIPEVRVPLPPLAEQRRVVARIEALAAQIHEARALRRQAGEEAEAMLVAMAHRADLDHTAKERAGWRRKRLGDVIRFVDDSHKVQPDRSYPNLGIYSFGRGLFHKPPINGAATSATALRRVQSGQFIYSRLFAFEGAYGTGQ
jgi:type I restriction enzyme S subunit